MRSFVIFTGKKLFMPDITLHTRLNPFQREAVRRLWNSEYPESLQLETPEDFEHYLENLPEKMHYLVMENQHILGWGMTFRRETATWFAMILDSSIHGKGIGSQILQRMKLAHKELFGWVIDHGNAPKADGTLYLSPLEFYRKNGCLVDETIRLELPTISAVQIRFNHQSIQHS
jgi:hypothetical protein